MLPIVQKSLMQLFPYASCALVSVFFEKKMLKVEEFNPLASEESEVTRTGLHTCSSIVLHFCLIDWEYFKHSMLVPESLSEEDEAC